LTGSRINFSGTQTATFSTSVAYSDSVTESFRVTVTDAATNTATADLNVTAVGPGKPSAAASISPSPLRIGRTSTTGTATGTASVIASGVPPFTYSWSRLTGSRISFSGTQTATFSVYVTWDDSFTESFRVTVTDSAGNTGSFVCIVVTVGTGSSGDTLGPVTLNVSATPDSAAPHDSIMIRAEVRDTVTGGSNIAGAEMRVDSGGFVPMFASDGAFDQQNERVNRLVVGLAVGSHSVCVRGRDTAGNTGNQTCIGFSVAATKSLPGSRRRGRLQP